MLDFWGTYHLEGLFIGICTFLIIGVFHPIVVKAEYYLGTRSWWIFFVAGMAGVAVSVLVSDIIASAILAVFAFSSFWSIKEVFEQKERVAKGWFPENPGKKKK